MGRRRSPKRAANILGQWRCRRAGTLFRKRKRAVASASQIIGPAVGITQPSLPGVALIFSRASAIDLPSRLFPTRRCTSDCRILPVRTLNCPGRAPERRRESDGDRAMPLAAIVCAAAGVGTGIM